MTTRNFRVNNGLEVGDIVISATANTITGGATAAPSADGQFANKKYVDDSIAAISTTAISQGNSNVTVADSGTGNVTIEVDGTDRITTVAATTTTATGHSLVIGADSVIDLSGELISKPNNRKEAMDILKKLNGREHYLISSVCISKNGSMIWNYTDKAKLKMKNLTEKELENYLSKISDKTLYAYNVYQIEGEGRNLFSEINGNEDTIMGLPVKKIKEYLKEIGWKNT